MLIGVVSDTHKSKWVFDNVYAKLKNVDLLIHLGDNVKDVDEFKNYFSCPIINVRGNCDFSTTTPSETIEVIEGKTFFITHGHNYNVKYTLLNLLYKAKEMGADVVLYGHTHISQILFQEGIWIVNPGSPSLARDGFNSVATIEIKDGKVHPSIISL